MLSEADEHVREESNVRRAVNRGLENRSEELTKEERQELARLFESESED
jgi:hypothetical protein